MLIDKHNEYSECRIEETYQDSEHIEINHELTKEDILKLKEKMNTKNESNGLLRADKLMHDSIEKDNAFIKICRILKSINSENHYIYSEQLKTAWRMIQLFEERFGRSQYLRIKYVRKLDFYNNELLN